MCEKCEQESTAPTMDTATTYRTPTGGWQTADTSGSQAKPNHPDQTKPRGGPCKTKPGCRGKLQLGGQKQPIQGVFLNHNKMSAPRPNQGVMQNCAKYTKGSGQSKPNHGIRPNQTTGSGQSKPNQGVKPRQTIPRGLVEQSNDLKVIGKLETKSELYSLRAIWTDGIQVHAAGLRRWNLHSSPGLQVHGTIRKNFNFLKTKWKPFDIIFPTILCFSDTIMRYSYSEYAVAIDRLNRFFHCQREWVV